MRGAIFSRYFKALAEGDPVALGVTALFVLFLAIVGVVMLKTRSEFKRDEANKRKKWGMKK